MPRDVLYFILLPVLCMLCSCQRDLQSSPVTPVANPTYDIDALRQFSDYATKRDLSNAVIGELVSIWDSTCRDGGLSEIQRTIAAQYFRMLSVDHRRRAFMRLTKTKEIDGIFRASGALALPGGYILAAKCPYPGRYKLPHPPSSGDNPGIIEVILAVMPDAGISIPERLLLSSGGQDRILKRVNFDEFMNVGFTSFQYNYYQCENHPHRDRWIAPILNNQTFFSNPLASNGKVNLPNLIASRADFPLVCSVLYLVDGNVSVGGSARVSGIADCITVDPTVMTDGVKHIVNNPDIIAHHFNPSYTDRTLSFYKSGKSLFKHAPFAFEITVNDPIGPDTQKIIQYPGSGRGMARPRSQTIRGTRTGDHLIVPITVTGHSGKLSVDALFDTGASRVCLPSDMSKHFSITDKISVSTANGDILAQCARGKVSTGDFERDVGIVFIPGQQALLGAAYFSGAKYTVDIENAEIIIVE